MNISENKNYPKTLILFHEFTVVSVAFREWYKSKPNDMILIALMTYIMLKVHPIHSRKMIK